MGTLTLTEKIQMQCWCTKWVFQCAGRVDFVGKIGCFRKTAKETAAIPSRSEFVSYCCVTGLPESYPNKEILGVVEPSEYDVKSGRTLVGRPVGYLKNSEIPVRMLNISQDNQIFYPGKLNASHVDSFLLTINVTKRSLFTITSAGPLWKVNGTSKAEGNLCLKKIIRKR